MDQDLTAVQIEECKTAFSNFDKNGDGVITREELSGILDSLGHAPSTAKITQILNDIDANGNGTIEYDEFLNKMVENMQRKTYDELQSAFHSYDTDEDDHITVEEVKLILRKLYTNLPQEKIEEMTSTAGLESEGKVAFKDLMVLMQTHGTNQQRADTITFLYGHM